MGELYEQVYYFYLQITRVRTNLESSPIDEFSLLLLLVLLKQLLLVLLFCAAAVASRDLSRFPRHPDRCPGCG